MIPCYSDASPQCFSSQFGNPELDKVFLFIVIFSWFLWSFLVFPWAYVNFCNPLYSMKELSRCISCYVMDHTLLLCSVAHLCVFTLHLSVVAFAEAVKHPWSSLHATPDLVDHCSPHLLSLNLENICALGIFFFFNEIFFIIVNILGNFSIPNLSFLNGRDRIASFCEVLANLRFLQWNMAAVWFILLFFSSLNSIKVSAPNFLYAPLSITEHLGSWCWEAWEAQFSLF